MALLVSVTTVISSSSSSVNAQTNSNELSRDDVEKVDLSKVTNLEEALNNVGLSKDNLLDNNFKIKGENISFINAKDNETGHYYNFYLEGNEIKYYSVQKEKENEHATFELYDLNNSFILSSEIDQNGNIIKEKTFKDQEQDGVQTMASSGINEAAFKWACIFSSYMACISIALAAGAAGALVSGPFGVAAGFAGGQACRYIFQTAVEEFGSKDKACKVLS